MARRLAPQFRALSIPALVLALGLAGCASNSALHRLDTTGPSGSAFAKALYDNYAYLARSLARSDLRSPVPGPGTNDIFGGFTSTETLAEHFARKAISASEDGDVAPEAASNTVEGSGLARGRLFKALGGGGRDKAPAAAARAQAGFDCWVLNVQIPSQARAAATCRATFEEAVGTTELALAPPAPAAPAAAPADFTVYFGFDEWSLSGEALSLITRAVQSAHDGRQSRITVVGHTDTSGPTDYNQRLSVRRANVVRDVIVQMGGRPAAVSASGVGETDLAVPTADGVREPKNRRSVITLVP